MNFLTLKHKKINQVLLFLLCILLFYDFCCFRSSFGSILRLNKWYTKQTDRKFIDLQAKLKNSLCHLFCTQNEKNLTFRVDLWSQKVMWPRNGMSDFHKLGVKISVRLQRKKSWSGAAESVAVLRAWQNLSRGGLRGLPPPPPSAVRVKMMLALCWLSSSPNSWLRRSELSLPWREDRLRWRPRRKLRTRPARSRQTLRKWLSKRQVYIQMIVSSVILEKISLRNVKSADNKLNQDMILHAPKSHSKLESWKFFSLSYTNITRDPWYHPPPPPPINLPIENERNS